MSTSKLTYLLIEKVKRAIERVLIIRLRNDIFSFNSGLDICWIELCTCKATVIIVSNEYDVTTNIENLNYTVNTMIPLIQVSFSYYTFYFCESSRWWRWWQRWSIGPWRHGRWWRWRAWWRRWRPSRLQRRALIVFIWECVLNSIWIA